MLPPSELTWDLVEPSLLAFAAADLDAGMLPAPTLVSFAGDEPLALTTLRPFGAGEALGALIEVLALLLPLGTDRLALALPGRGWCLDEPPPEISDGGPDPRQHLVVVSRADGHDRRPARLTTSLHPFDVGGTGWRWGDRLDPPERPCGEVPDALTALLDARNDLTHGGASELAAQFGRVLLLGHELALAPGAAAQIDLACSRARPGP